MISLAVRESSNATRPSLASHANGFPSSSDCQKHQPVESTVLSALSAQSRYEGELLAKLPGGAATKAGEAFSTLRATRLEVVASNNGRQVARASVDIQMLYDSPELARPEPAPDNLTALATGSGGRILTSASEVAELLREFPSTPGEILVHRSPLWDRSLFWGLLLALLCVEWSIRRRAGFG